jgi:hypothetical protein
MSDLRDAARQALAALEGGGDSWRLIGPAIDALRAALAEEALQRLTDVHQEIEAALEQPEQEPVAKSTWQKLYETAIDQRNEAVAELRRLHAKNVLLHERHHFDNGVLAELLEALKRLHDATWLVSKGHYNEELHDIAVSKARAVIAKAERQV